MIYYSGHGTIDNGAWNMTDQKEASINLDSTLVSIVDIIKTINESDYKMTVEIEMDSCFGGKMCHRAKEYYENNNEINFKCL